MCNVFTYLLYILTFVRLLYDSTWKWYSLYMTFWSCTITLYTGLYNFFNINYAIRRHNFSPTQVTLNLSMHNVIPSATHGACFEIKKRIPSSLVCFWRVHRTDDWSHGVALLPNCVCFWWISFRLDSLNLGSHIKKRPAWMPRRKQTPWLDAITRNWLIKRSSDSGTTSQNSESTEAIQRNVTSWE